MGRAHEVLNVPMQKLLQQKQNYILVMEKKSI